LPAYQVVGLPDAAVRESRERVRAAVLSSALEWPQRRITVNLAPGGVRKTGSGLELAVALGVLGANDALPAGVPTAWRARRARARRQRAPGAGTLALADGSRGRAGCSWSDRERREAALVGGVRVRAARTLGDLRACLKGEESWPDWDPAHRSQRHRSATATNWSISPTCAAPFARSALEVAAAADTTCAVRSSRHRQDVLAHRLGTILPSLSHAEALEVTRIHSRPASRSRASS